MKKTNVILIGGKHTTISDNPNQKKKRHIKHDPIVIWFKNSQDILFIQFVKSFCWKNQTKKNTKFLIVIINLGNRISKLNKSIPTRITISKNKDYIKIMGCSVSSSSSSCCLSNNCERTSAFLNVRIETESGKTFLMQLLPSMFVWQIKNKMEMCIAARADSLQLFIE